MGLALCIIWGHLHKLSALLHGRDVSGRCIGDVDTLCCASASRLGGVMRVPMGYLWTATLRPIWNFFCPHIKRGCSLGLTMPARMLEADDSKRYWCRPKCSTEMQWKDRLRAILIFSKGSSTMIAVISLPAFLSNLEWANKGRISLPVGSFSERLQSALHLNYRRNVNLCESVSTAEVFMIYQVYPNKWNPKVCQEIWLLKIETGENRSNTWQGTNKWSVVMKC